MWTNICVTQKSLCGKSNKTHLLFAKKVLCGRTKMFWVLACCGCCTKQIKFAAEADNDLRQMQEQFQAEALNDLRQMQETFVQFADMFF